MMASRRYLAEALGTFALVFAGTGAIVVDDLTAGTISHVGIALTFGLVVMTMIYAVGDISGAHLNPAVTVGFWAARRLPARDVGPYVLSQCLGAIAASALLKLMFSGRAALGATAPAGTLSQSFLLEIVITAMLMFVILGVATGTEKGVMAGVAVGGTVALAALFAGPVSGASMNPARSLGPALLGGRLEVLWLYILAPVAGAYLAVLGCRCVREPGCCSLRD